MHDGEHPSSGRIGLPLLRLALRALRVTASTIALVALLRQEWIPAVAFALVWLLIQAVLTVLPQLLEPRSDS